MPILTSFANSTVRGYGGIGNSPIKTDFALMQRYIASSPQTDVTFSSLDTSFTHLRLVCYIKTTENTQSTLLRLRFNNDSGGNYTRIALYQGGGTLQTFAGVGRLSIDASVTSGSMTTPVNMTNQFSMAMYTIPDFASTSKKKVVQVNAAYDTNSTADDPEMVIGGGMWDNQSAITSINISCAAGNVATGSVLSLYGFRIS